MLRRNFSEALVILYWFFLLFLLIWYITLALHYEVFQRELFSISIVQIYKNLIFSWSVRSKCFGNQWNIIKYFWFKSSEQSSCTLSEEQQNFLNIHASIQSKKVKKIFKNEAAEPYLEPCQISMMERFCQDTNGLKLNHRHLIWF